MRITNGLPLENTTVTGPFWARLQELVTNEVIPLQEKILDDALPGAAKSHALENFRIAAGEVEGEFYGMVFQDSDVAKWLEAAAYSLTISPDPELRSRAEAVIGLIGRAQQPDGYLNTYFTIKEPERRWQNLRECHELYCAGHMFEAAAAWFESTGDRSLLDISLKMADHIYDRFITDGCEGVPGHQEVELGLLRLHRVTGEEKYLELARHFIDTRGQNPDFFGQEHDRIGWWYFGPDKWESSYNQSHLPVREQSDAVGHSVRAVYMYTAMAEIAAETGDTALLDACSRLWDSITKRRMYITGGIGQTARGEAFSIDYELPNDLVYAETCASIGLVFFAKSMLELRPHGVYADVMEQALYNGVISGMQLDGKSFFYVNPLEVNPGVSGVLPEYAHALPQRPGWYACACCPPNLARLVASLGRYAWSEGGGTLFSHLYLGGSAKFSCGAEISLETNYPWEGKMKYTVSLARSRRFVFAVRVPGWARGAALYVNGVPLDAADIMRGGYAYIDREWACGDTVELSFGLNTRRMYANTAVRADAGCTALMRGPLVYCFEGADNGPCLQALQIPRDAEIRALPANGLLPGVETVLSVEGQRLAGGDGLYCENPPVPQAQTLTAVPYYAWGNREPGQMRVWMSEVSPAGAQRV